MVFYSHVKSRTATQITGTSNKMNDSSVSWGNQKLGKIVRHETTNSKGSEDLKMTLNGVYMFYLIAGKHLILILMLPMSCFLTQLEPNLSYMHWGKKWS